MLELQEIKKAYTTASLTQIALNNVSVAFRDNEFVAILGQSGSGKTTMLNIIGGLDRFDSGDLVIDGISTRHYKDRDWDTYRNNRIGFVFQAYNLIGHQTVLSNVELALTLSGVSATERRQRALAALEEVGLKDHVHKKPNQLSGGQMQRVAIARALVNDPEILLADEPTGALDSETSLQVMDLLREVAKDRLVIMVTHNPDLAHQYATRIVELADGKIIGDSHPFNPATEASRVAKNINPSKMGFLTAVSLSFANLMTKKGRTLMTAFAGSIGIIGIAAILSLANGVNEYIARSEEELLASYPLTIDKVGLDIGALLGGQNDQQGESTQSDEASAASSIHGDQPASGTITTRPVINQSLGMVNSNDLKSLRAFIEKDGRIQRHSQAIDYTYAVDPLIYLPMDNLTTKGKPTQAHPSTLLDTPSFRQELPSQFTAGARTDTFRPLPSNQKIYADDIELVEGALPTNARELLVVLPKSGQLPDVMELNMGLRNRDEVEALIKERTKKARNGLFSSADVPQSAYVPEPARYYQAKDLIGLKYRHVHPADCYVWDESLKVWADKSDDESLMKKLINSGQELTIVGVAKNSSQKDIPVLQPGVYYTQALVRDTMLQAEHSRIVKDQRTRPEVNVFTGIRFDQKESGSPLQSFDMSKLLKIDEKKIAEAFSGGLSGGLDEAFAGVLGGVGDFGDFAQLDLSGLDLSALDFAGLDLSGIDLSQISLSGIDLSGIDLSGLNAAALSGNGLDVGSLEATGLDAESVAKMLTQAGQNVVPQLRDQVVAEVMPQIQEQFSRVLADQFQTIGAQVMEQIGQAIQVQIAQQMESAASSFGSALNGLSVDEGALAQAFQISADAQELSSLFASLMSGGQDTYERNLKKLGYGDLADPDGINIYPASFQDKEDIKRILDDYNAQQRATGSDSSVITYSDLVGALMSQVTTIVNMVSAMLIAFVAISLVVSSIMIGIITYISVLERKKEIGILRSIGASKRDIRHVFNAETLLIGLLAGLIGIGVTIGLIIPANLIIQQNFNVEHLIVLPPLAGVVLVAISMFLTWIAGLMPANKAAKADPVEALRSE